MASGVCEMCFGSELNEGAQGLALFLTFPKTMTKTAVRSFERSTQNDISAPNEKNRWAADVVGFFWFGRSTTLTLKKMADAVGGREGFFLTF